MKCQVFDCVTVDFPSCVTLVIYFCFKFFFLFCCFLAVFFVFFVHSVKYEDPQALGGLASALDVRQQNTGGVSTPIHVV